MREDRNGATSGALGLHPAKGFVERGTCESDRRVVYAVLTEDGLAKLRQASKSHVAQIEELFAERFDEGELGTGADFLTRLGESASDEGCAPPES